MGYFTTKRRSATTKIYYCAPRVRCNVVVHSESPFRDELWKHGPVYFTIGLLNRNAPNNPLAWRPHGYIPNIGLKSKAESAHDIKGRVKVQLYHDIVAKINKSLVKIAQAGGLPSSFVYKGNPYHVTLKFPVLVVRVTLKNMTSLVPIKHVAIPLPLAYAATVTARLQKHPIHITKGILLNMLTLKFL